uniref:ATP synthase complex subunit 8 n=1 Tax=Ctenolucius hujeta TaxID=303997 RepID=F7UIL0_9TELE|nr:ATPase subunit 8 [Ctenolucius hujeta]
MPQLNPAPWFAIFMFSWLIFLLIPSKILKYTFSNDPSPLHAEKPKTEPWNWPWH